MKEQLFIYNVFYFPLITSYSEKSYSTSAQKSYLMEIILNWLSLDFFGRQNFFFVEKNLNLT